MLVLVSQIMAFHFVHFEYKKEYLQILVKLIVYRVSLSSSQSDKKQFQLIDLVPGVHNVLTSIYNGFPNCRLLD